jgi:uncharacterized protein YndB with AHSA1/START domain
MNESNKPVDDIVCEVEISAPRERVWDVLTHRETTPLWLGCLGYTGKPGATFYMQPDPEKRQTNDLSGATHCEIETLNAPSTFVFSWFFPDTPKTYVRIDLEEAGENLTRVRLKHFGWEQFPADIIRHVRDGLAGGWESAVLPNLKRVAEEG